jgi:hypothetical protein
MEARSPRTRANSRCASALVRSSSSLSSSARPMAGRPLPGDTADRPRWRSAAPARTAGGRGRAYPGRPRCRRAPPCCPARRRSCRRRADCELPRRTWTAPRQRSPMPRRPGRGSRRRHRAGSGPQVQPGPGRAGHGVRCRRHRRVLAPATHGRPRSSPAPSAGRSYPPTLPRGRGPGRRQSTPLRRRRAAIRPRRGHRPSAATSWTRC